MHPTTSNASTRRSANALPGVPGSEGYFAVETFDQCVESYREAGCKDDRGGTPMTTSAVSGIESALKDRRDRRLNDVYYIGHCAAAKAGSGSFRKSSETELPCSTRGDRRRWLRFVISQSADACTVRGRGYKTLWRSRPIV